MDITIFGTGYVGLVSGAGLTEAGHNVVCMDVNPVKIEKLKTGILTIWEPGLEALVERNVIEGRLHFTTDVAHAVQYGQVKFIALGPPDEDGSDDLQYVLAERGVKISFDIFSNPEFLKEGSAVDDFLKPERTIFMDVRSAELIKYAVNAMLTNKISFMNKMANLAERLGADIEEMRKGIGAALR